MITEILAAALLQAAPATLTAELRAKDQALLDAIAPGNRALWDQTLSPDAVYVDENGLIYERAAFLAELKPLSGGSTGTLTIVDYSVRVAGDTALVIHKDNERENYHGVALHADYLMTETWLKRDGEWRLAMVHSYTVAKDPPAIAVASSKLDDYVGVYHAGDNLTYTITREGDHLVGRSESGKARPLAVEIADVLFSPGQPRTKRLFQRDESGHVAGFIDRREGEDLIWRRTAP